MVGEEEEEERSGGEEGREGADKPGFREKRRGWRKRAVAGGGRKGKGTRFQDSGKTQRASLSLSVPRRQVVKQ